MKRLIGLAIALALTLAPAIAAQAHAFLDHADPKVGAEVARARQVRLWFTEALAPAFCRVTVTGPPGFGGAGPARTAPGDPKSLVVDLHPPVPAGLYVVHWRVVSVDTHTTQGEFTFKVRG